MERMGVKTPPSHQRHQKRLPGPCRGAIPSGKLDPWSTPWLSLFINQKPNSFTHSLQIHCTGLTGPKSQASWAGSEKRDPTHAIYNKTDNSIIIFYNILILKIFRIIILQNTMMLDPFKFIFRICIFFSMTWRSFFSCKIYLVYFRLYFIDRVRIKV